MNNHNQKLLKTIQEFLEQYIEKKLIYQHCSPQLMLFTQILKMI